MRHILACALMAFATHALASNSCPQFSPKGKSPAAVNPRIAAKTRLLCYSDFEMLHSNITHAPLWSAEHLTRSHLAAAKNGVRTSRFFEEPRLTTAMMSGEGHE
ncbi:DNA/RNA non-specific endonuclease [Burkholderia cepacia]|uniref:DNA/RNA non-specific endonuclease n=1 Tax=Burkholderia cepacia TaxID=292 RepID=UPI00158B5EAA|nr:DNA/RNA non-specific endonuclease [Burkholderia cepacia]